MNRDRPAAQTGLLYAIFAYTAWGLLPIYWKLFGQIPAVEVLTHRMLWSMVLLTSLLVLLKRRSELAQVLHKPKSIAILLGTALLLTFNWGLYIYGVNTDRVVETSLGYFINPLASVLLGFVFLKERLNRAQVVAVLLAAVGVG
ncbi:MAG: EamA family transporter, partial [Microcoleus sp. SIO2G3]|nr:EamA family transporter [Microcoleus sp. SIO2G3]